jgi:hypothetical protein
VIHGSPLWQFRRYDVAIVIRRAGEDDVGCSHKMNDVGRTGSLTLRVAIIIATTVCDNEIHGGHL